MRKLISAVALFMAFAAFGCGDSSVQPLSTGNQAQIGGQSPGRSSGGEILQPTAATTRPLIGYGTDQWQYVGATSEELQAVSTGRAVFSHMGPSTQNSEFTLSLTTGVAHGATTWTVASGEQITTSWVSTPTSLTERLINVTVTGGTGRFEDAVGTVVGHSTILSSDASGGSSKSRWDGSLTY